MAFLEGPDAPIFQKFAWWEQPELEVLVFLVKFQEGRTAKPECSKVEFPVPVPVSAGRRVELPAAFLLAGQREWQAVVALFAAADLRSNVA